MNDLTRRFLNQNFYNTPTKEMEKTASDIESLYAQKDAAYKERDMLVSLLTKVFPAWLERHPDADTEWEDDWRWIVFVELPTGQASWHIHDSELDWFDHLGRRIWQTTDDQPSWDGHTTEEKYQRVLAVPLRDSKGFPGY